MLNFNNIHDIDDIVSVCAGLVAVDNKTSTIRLVRYTAQEYFESVRLTLNPTAREDIGVACLTYLSFNEFKSGSCPSDQSLEERCAKNQFFDYSARHWSEHVRPIQDCNLVSEVALTFLRSDALVDSVTQAASISLYSDKRRHFTRGTRGLHLTARLGLVFLTQALLVSEPGGNNIEVDPTDGRGRTPLAYAAKGGHEAIVKLLIDRGADLNANFPGNGNIIELASAHAQKQAAELLLDRGVRFSEPGSYHSNTLDKASECGHAEIVELLLDKGGDISAKGGHYNHALLTASAHGHEQVVRSLLDNGASANAQNSLFGTVLHAALADGHEQVVRLLFDRGAKIGAESGRYGTAFEAALESRNEQIIKLLLDMAASVADKDSRARKVLLAASRKGYSVEDLLLTR